PPDIHTLSLHDALPIWPPRRMGRRMKTLLVLGATGTMGRRIVALAGRLLPGVRVLQGARRVAPETDPDSRAVDIHDAGSVRRALDRKSTRLNSSHVAIS